MEVSKCWEDGGGNEAGSWPALVYPGHDNWTYTLCHLSSLICLLQCAFFFFFVSFYPGTWAVHRFISYTAVTIEPAAVKCSLSASGIKNVVFGKLCAYFSSYSIPDLLAFVAFCSGWRTLSLSLSLCPPPFFNVYFRLFTCMWDIYDDFCTRRCYLRLLLLHPPPPLFSPNAVYDFILAESRDVFLFLFPDGYYGCALVHTHTHKLV